MKLDVMGKGKRLKDKRKGLLSEFSDRLTLNFQRELRNSELWDQMESRARCLWSDLFGDSGPLSGHNAFWLGPFNAVGHLNCQI